MAKDPIFHWLAKGALLYIYGSMAQHMPGIARQCFHPLLRHMSDSRQGSGQEAVGLYVLHKVVEGSHMAIHQAGLYHGRMGQELKSSLYKEHWMTYIDDY